MGRDPDGKDFLDYNETAFVDWLNGYILKNSQEKAKITGTHHIDNRERGHAIIPVEYKGYPHIGF